MGKLKFLDQVFGDGVIFAANPNMARRTGTAAYAGAATGTRPVALIAAFSERNYFGGGAAGT